MNKIFISHSSRQKDLVEKLTQELGRDRCIVDAFDFEPASKLEDEIKRWIDEAKIFGLLISNDSLNSDWVRFEENYVKPKVENGDIVFLGFIIDSTIDISSDKRIALWEKNYILDVIPSAKILSRVIAARIRELDYLSFPFLKYRNSFFFGRGREVSELENAYILKYADSCKAVFISGLPHVGRKRFALEFLRKVSGNHQKDFCSISLEKDQSIEDLILYLNDYVENYKLSDLTTVLAEGDLREKRNIVVSLFNQLYSYRQEVLIIDNSCLIHTDGRLSDWFSMVLKSKELEQHTGVYIVSQIRLDPRQLDQLPAVQEVLNPLTTQDMVVLFQAYSEKRGLRLPIPETETIGAEIGGFPSYVYPIVDTWSQFGREAALRKLDDFKTSTADVLSHIIEILNEEETGNRIQLLILLSRFDVASIKQLRILLPNIELNVNLENELEKFQMLSILEYFGYAREYVRIHPAVADYIKRSRTLKMNPNLIRKVSKKASSLISSVNSNEGEGDLPTYLYGIKETLRSGLSSEKDISRYMIPSLALSVIVEEYEAGHYENVDTLCQRMLERKKNYDQYILRSVHYWQCLAYCRTSNPQINTAVEFFGESPTKHFLLGFFYRLQGRIDRAESEYETSMRLAGEHSESYKLKQELVLVKILRDDYEGALAMAQENYLRQPHNYFFIEAYFRCYIKDIYAEKETLLRLIDEMKKSQDNNRIPISQTMEAEYKFYRQGDFWGAVKDLKGLIERYPALKYPQNALKDICKRNHKESYYRQVLSELRERGVSV